MTTTTHQDAGPSTTDQAQPQPLAAGEELAGALSAPLAAAAPPPLIRATLIAPVAAAPPATAPAPPPDPITAATGTRKLTSATRATRPSTIMMIMAKLPVIVSKVSSLAAKEPPPSLACSMIHVENSSPISTTVWVTAMAEPDTRTSSTIPRTILRRPQSTWLPPAPPSARSPSRCPASTGHSPVPPGWTVPTPAPRLPRPGTPPRRQRPLGDRSRRTTCTVRQPLPTHRLPLLSHRPGHEPCRRWVLQASHAPVLVRRRIDLPVPSTHTMTSGQDTTSDGLLAW